MIAPFHPIVFLTVICKEFANTRILTGIGLGLFRIDSNDLGNNDQSTFFVSFRRFLKALRLRSLRTAHEEDSGYSGCLKMYQKRFEYRGGTARRKQAIEQ